MKTATILGIVSLLVLGTVSSVFASIDKNLKYGQRDPEVAELQEFLIDRGLLKTAPTNFFGLLTLKAVKAYQLSVNVSPTGFVGVLTREKINKEIDIEIASSTEAEISETGTTTSVQSPTQNWGVNTQTPASPVYVPYPVYVPSPAPVTPTVVTPTVVQAPTMTEVKYDRYFMAPEISVDGTRADVFVDVGQVGDVITITYNGVEKTVTLSSENFHGRSTMPYFNLATDLTPNTTYNYTVKTVRGTKFATGAGTFFTK